MAQWFVTSIPETLIFMIFINYMLKSNMNIYISTLIIALSMSITRTYTENNILLHFSISFFVTMGVVYLFTKSNLIKIFQYLAFVTIFCILIDTASAVLLHITTGVEYAQLTNNFDNYFIIVMYTAILKALLLPYYLKIRRRFEKV